MSTQRLSNATRDQIVNLGKEFITKEQRAELKKLGTEVIKATQAFVYSPSVLRVINSLPPSFVGKRKHISFAVDPKGGGSKEIYTVEGGEDVLFGRGDYEGNYDSGRVLLLEGESDQALINLVRKYSEAEKRLKSNEKKFAAMAKQTVYSVTTIKKLLEVWPKCEVFLPASYLAAPQKEYLPATVTQTLDHMLGDALTRKPKADQAATAEA